MSINKSQLLSPLFLKYQADFEKNPRSRVFAPLAEIYRKLGITNKAMEILSQGIRFHPTYLMGYLGLAFCYYDLRQYNLAYSTLRPLVELNRDNLRLQKLFADICIKIEKKEEALDTLKYLLFINPRDKDIGDLVINLEREVDELYRPLHKPVMIPNDEDSVLEAPSFFDLEKMRPNEAVVKEDGFDQWSTVDLSLNVENELRSLVNNSKDINKEIGLSDYTDWNFKKGDEVVDLFKQETPEEIRHFHVVIGPIIDSLKPAEALLKEVNLSSAINKIENDLEADEESTVTHTLVDLYCSQGHIDRALEVLEKILILNPRDKKTWKKIEEIKSLASPMEEITSRFLTIEDGRRQLMSLIGEKVVVGNEIEEKKALEIKKQLESQRRLDATRLIEEKLSLFLTRIQKRALDYQSRF